MLLNKIAQNTGMTECGKNWLTFALDPMHDNQIIHLSGWPDQSTAPSISRAVKKTLTVRTNQPVGQLWDASIVVWPWLATPVLYTYNSPGFNVMTEPPLGGPVTPNQVSAYCVPANGPVAYEGAPTSGVSIGIPSDMNGQGRCIAMGFEIFNATAEIYKQGSVVVWRQAVNMGESETTQFKTGAVVTNVASTKTIVEPPRTATDAYLLPGSRQWKAADGCYVVVPFSGLDNPAKPPEAIAPLVVIGADRKAGPSQAQSIMTGPGTSADVTNKLIPINQVGAYFSGLSDQTILTVNVIWYYEYFPSVYDQVMLPLARPSCEPDYNALKMYAEMLNTLPVGVPFDWNAEGDWWWDVVSGIREHAGTIGSLFGGPGTLIGTAASAAAAAYQDGYMTAPSAKKPAQPGKRPKPKPPQPRARPAQRKAEVVKIVEVKDEGRGGAGPARKGRKRPNRKNKKPLNRKDLALVKELLKGY